MLKFSIYDQLSRRILVLDGGLGTMIQGYGLGEEDYRGERFAGSEVLLKGCNDLLVLTKPEAIRSIHEAYLQAGADIISTDSFNANAVSMADYALQEYVYEINRAAAALARSEADRFTLRNPSKPRFVAGSMGPTNRTASISPDVNDPGYRAVTFDELAEAYYEQARGLVDGGTDVLLVETVFDTLNAKAALFAIERLRAERGVPIPVMVSGTITDASGRTLSGQTIEAFYTSVSHAGLLSVGLNCGFGAEQMQPYVARLASVAECAVSAHPNAGLPNGFGGYDETPQRMAETIDGYLREGLLNIVGGCCGTTPVHIAEIARVADGRAPRKVPAPSHVTTLSGLETLRVTPEANFVNVGERTNVAGSAKFAGMIREGRYEEALSVARQQVDYRYFHHGVASRLLLHRSACHAYQYLCGQCGIIDAHVEFEQLILGFSRYTFAGQVYTVSHVQECIHARHLLYVGFVVHEISVRFDCGCHVFKFISVFQFDVYHAAVDSCSGRDSHR